MAPESLSSKHPGQILIMLMEIVVQLFFWDSRAYQKIYGKILILKIFL